MSKLRLQWSRSTFQFGSYDERLSWNLLFCNRRGGQHPTFDAEVRFKITEDAEDIVNRPNYNDGDPIKAKKSRRIPKNKSMVVTVFADDPKEPKLVGETVVDLTAVFEKCEHDGTYFNQLSIVLSHRLLCRHVRIEIQGHVCWRDLPGNDVFHQR
jgi:hypothetical protein